MGGEALDQLLNSYYDPLGDAPPPAPLPDHEMRLAKLVTSLATTRQSLAQTRSVLRKVVTDEVVLRHVRATLPPWWRDVTAILHNRPLNTDDEE